MIQILKGNNDFFPTTFSHLLAKLNKHLSLFIFLYKAVVAYVVS